jgi:hypothetical protein
LENGDVEKVRGTDDEDEDDDEEGKEIKDPYFTSERI